VAVIASFRSSLFIYRPQREVLNRCSFGNAD
jgi:hypothetical protein